MGILCAHQMTNVRAPDFVGSFTTEKESARGNLGAPTPLKSLISSALSLIITKETILTFARRGIYG